MQEEIHQLQQEDLLEQEWLDDFRRREEIASKERLGGRTSGTREWRSQREELGQAAKNQLPVMKGECDTTWSFLLCKLRFSS